MIKRDIAVAVTVITAALVTVACAAVPSRGASDADPDVRVELVDRARYAQNAHNHQAWRVVLDPLHTRRFDLFIDSARLLPETDAFARQAVLSVGTFLAVVHGHAAELGYEAQIELLPEGDLDEQDLARLPAARVTLVAHAGARSAFAAAADLDAISSATVKWRYRPAQLRDETVERILSYAHEGFSWAVITDPTRVARLNELSIAAFTIEMEYEPTLMETYRSMRWNGRDRRETPYGLAFTASMSRATLPFTDIFMTLTRPSPSSYANSGIGMFADAMDDINTYVTLVTADNSRRTQIEAGMALQAVWMELQRAGHVVLANSQALQEYAPMAGLYDAAHREIAPDGGTVQMLLAVAQPRGGSHVPSPRLAVDDLIAATDDAGQ